MRQRQSGRQVFWRAAVAATSNLAMVSGLYPLAPHLLRRFLRRAETLPSGAARARGRLAAEWALAWAVSATRPLGLLERPVWGRARGGRPVVLVHGYAMSRAYFLLLARRLERAGCGPFYGFEYWTLGKVASAAKRLGDYVDRLCDDHGVDQVDLIGHSMGGVVARYYAALGGGAARVRRLVTIGSPHCGTEVSYFGVGRPVRELLPGSSLLERLAAAGLPDGSEALCIWSRGDALVWCEGQARLPGAREVVYDDLGHLSMLASRRVAAEVAGFLRAGEPRSAP
ncbi:MAG TPA: alpha/beta fold hydrolase [Kofleriaceae bacterium]|nr:alpha/beta fold hydrolase [Kofleriaceae bacterium]